jgi:hypothetical protein
LQYCRRCATVSSNELILKPVYYKVAYFKMDETNEHLLELWKSVEKVASEGKKNISYMPKKMALKKSHVVFNLDESFNFLEPYSAGNTSVVKTHPRIILPAAISVIFSALTIILFLFFTSTLAFIFFIPTICIYIVLIRAVRIRLKS